MEQAGESIYELHEVQKPLEDGSSGRYTIHQITADGLVIADFISKQYAVGVFEALKRKEAEGDVVQTKGAKRAD